MKLRTLFTLILLAFIGVSAVSGTPANVDYDVGTEHGIYETDARLADVVITTETHFVQTNLGSVELATTVTITEGNTKAQEAENIGYTVDKTTIYKAKVNHSTNYGSINKLLTDGLANQIRTAVVAFQSFSVSDFGSMNKLLVYGKCN